MKTRSKVLGLATFFLALMLIVWPTSCKKDPQPTLEQTTTDTIPDVPGGDAPEPPVDTLQPGNDTIVPGPGGDTIVPGGGKVVKFYYEGGGFMFRSIRYNVIKMIRHMIPYTLPFG